MAFLWVIEMSKLNKVIEDLECLIEEMGEDGYHGSESVIKAHDHLIKYEDLLSYDEAKERELFTAFAMEHFLNVHRRDNGDYFYTEALIAWAAWKVCAKSRARSAE